MLIQDSNAIQNYLRSSSRGFIILQPPVVSQTVCTWLQTKEKPRSLTPSLFELPFSHEHFTKI